MDSWPASERTGLMCRICCVVAVKFRVEDVPSNDSPSTPPSHEGAEIASSDGALTRPREQWAGLAAFYSMEGRDIDPAPP